MYEQEKEILKNKTHFDIEDLRLILKILRAPGGCPWDREQDHKSIVTSLIEETYEAVEAIENDSVEMLREEIGDVLLQVVFHTTMEEEAGNFDFNDAVTDECIKMIVRHPHVFGDVKADTSEEVLKNWDAIKAETKKQKSLGERLDSIAKTLPALVRMQKVIHKTAKEGVELNLEAKLSDEVTTECAKKLFEAIKFCEQNGIDAETVLRHYTDEVIKAF